MTSYTNAVAVVTGGASGIGKAVCTTLAREGACIVAADIDFEGARRVADTLPNALAQHVDVTDFASMQTMIEATIARHGRVNYFFNNAGIATVGEVHDLVPDDWRKVIEVNLMGVVNGIHAVYPRMIAQGGGHIINTGSIAGLIPVPTGAAYTATKHAVLGLSQSLRHEAVSSESGAPDADLRQHAAQDSRQPRCCRPKHYACDVIATSTGQRAERVSLL